MCKEMDFGVSQSDSRKATRRKGAQSNCGLNAELPPR